MWSGIAVRYLKVQCTSVRTLQTQDLGQSPLVGSTAAKNNRAFSSHLRWQPALQPHALIVHGDGDESTESEEQRDGMMDYKGSRIILQASAFKSFWRYSSVQRPIRPVLWWAEPDSAVNFIRLYLLGLSDSGVQKHGPSRCFCTSSHSSVISEELTIESLQTPSVMQPIFLGKALQIRRIALFRITGRGDLDRDTSL
ncbi:hypothetical protein EYF80_009335 [Liparis tanakae]|uniref:Uncharacterized protein n=1 Tax=Liparis tanakae TaxID=230148 RepID=A0A4Z2IR59_9TELE|nr:hypothetical protein EYF80_009335 [Liparis tanakae]